MNRISPEIVRAEPAREKDKINALWEKNFGKDLNARYSWLYENERSPAPFVFTAESEQSAVVGMIALMHRNFSFREKDVPGGQTIDFMVDKEYRNLFTALKLQKSVIQAAHDMRIELVYGFPNEKSEPVQKRTGFADIGPFQRWVKVLHTEPRLSKILNSSQAAKPLSAAADFALHIGSREFWHSHTNQIQASIEQGFDSRFDDLWKSVRRHYPLIGERNADFLSWRFNNCPHKKYRVFCIHDNNRRLLAYAVFFQENDRIHVDDFLARDEKCLDHLLIQLSALMRRSVVSSISLRFLGSSNVEEVLSRNGFLRRPSQERLLVHASHEHNFGSYVSNKQAWYMTEADHDT